MKIESLEINLLKASEVKDGDKIIVKIDETDRKKLSSEEIKELYAKIQKMINKDIGIFFFPKNLELSVIKSVIENVEKVEKENPNKTNEN